MIQAFPFPLMSYGLRRFLVLVAVFVLTFVVVFVIRRLQEGEDIFSFLNRGSSREFRPESYTLPEKPPLDLGEVEMLRRLNDEYASLTRAVVPSVVSIDTMGIRRERFGDLWGRVWERRYQTQGIGSGVIVTEEGHVVTNQHVIADKTRIQVTLYDGKTYPARLIGEDSQLDIAVLRIEGRGDFQPLILGDSDRVETGQMVFAVGNPFGLGETVTQGIISAKERSISDQQRDLFQTDAAINPGNSGGPLVNLYGEIIGVNVAVISREMQTRGASGVGFSIPSNDVREAFRQILERGRAPQHGYFGVAADDLTNEWRKELEYKGDGGAVIARVVPGSPAEKSGLRRDDIIRIYDKVPVQSRSHFLELIQRSQVGRQVEVEIWRGGEQLILTPTIVDVNEAPALPRPEPPTRIASDEEVQRAVGISVRDLASGERIGDLEGVVVVSVSPGGLAARAGIVPGDVIMGINGFVVRNTPEFLSSLLASAPTQSTSLQIDRKGKRGVLNLEQVPRSEGRENP